MAVKAELSQALKTHRRQVIAAPDRVSAAVLIPLYKRDGETWVLFVRRAADLRYHGGQIAFPGGTRDPGDRDLTATALREAEEEVGLKPADVTVIGELDDVITSTSNFIVTPLVGYIPWPYPLRLNQREVAAVIEVPLAALRDPRQQQPETERLDESDVLMTTYHYRKHLIWGATARILTQLLGLTHSAPE